MKSRSRALVSATYKSRSSSLLRLDRPSSLSAVCGKESYSFSFSLSCILKPMPWSAFTCILRFKSSSLKCPEEPHRNTNGYSKPFDLCIVLTDTTSSAADTAEARFKSPPRRIIMFKYLTKPDRPPPEFFS